MLQFYLQLLLSVDLSSDTFQKICSSAEHSFVIYSNVSVPLMQNCDINNGQLVGNGHTIRFASGVLFRNVRNFQFFDVKFTFDLGTPQLFAEITQNSFFEVVIFQETGQMIKTAENISLIQCKVFQSQILQENLTLFDDLKDSQIVGSTLNLNAKISTLKISTLLINITTISYNTKAGLPLLGSQPKSVAIQFSQVFCKLANFKSALFSCISNGAENLTFKQLFVSISVDQVLTLTNLYLIDRSLAIDSQHTVMTEDQISATIAELFNVSTQFCIACTPPATPNADHSYCELMCKEFFKPNPDLTLCVLSCEGFFMPNKDADGCDLVCPPMFAEIEKVCECGANAICTNDTFLKCKNGFYQAQDTCVVCAINSICENGLIECLPGFHKQISGGIVNCVQCPVENSICDDQGNFVKCQYGFYQQNNQCISCPSFAQCNDGQILCYEDFVLITNTCYQKCFIDCNNGFCYVNFTSNLCRCDGGFQGDNCDIPICFPDQIIQDGICQDNCSLACQNEGICRINQQNRLHFCECKNDNFIGTFCELCLSGFFFFLEDCITTLECAAILCNNQGICKNQMTPICFCSNGSKEKDCLIEKQKNILYISVGVAIAVIFIVIISIITVICCKRYKAKLNSNDVIKVDKAVLNIQPTFNQQLPTKRQTRATSKCSNISNNSQVSQLVGDINPSQEKLQLSNEQSKRASPPPDVVIKIQIPKPPKIIDSNLPKPNKAGVLDLIQSSNVLPSQTRDLRRCAFDEVQADSRRKIKLEPIRHEVPGQIKTKRIKVKRVVKQFETENQDQEKSDQSAPLESGKQRLEGSSAFDQDLQMP